MTHHQSGSGENQGPPGCWTNPMSFNPSASSSVSSPVSLFHGSTSTVCESNARYHAPMSSPFAQFGGSGIAGTGSVPGPSSYVPQQAGSGPYGTQHIRLPAVMNLCCLFCKNLIPVADMQRHLRLHLGYAPFMCSHCHRTFPDELYLQGHAYDNGHIPVRCRMVSNEVLENVFTLCWLWCRDAQMTEPAVLRSLEATIQEQLRNSQITLKPVDEQTSVSESSGISPPPTPPLFLGSAGPSRSTGPGPDLAPSASSFLPSQPTVIPNQVTVTPRPNRDQLSPTCQDCHEPCETETRRVEHVCQHLCDDGLPPLYVCKECDFGSAKKGPLMDHVRESSHGFRTSNRLKIYFGVRWKDCFPTLEAPSLPSIGHETTCLSSNRPGPSVDSASASTSTSILKMPRNANFSEPPVGAVERSTAGSFLDFMGRDETQNEQVSECTPSPDLIADLDRDSEVEMGVKSGEQLQNVSTCEMEIQDGREPTGTSESEERNVSVIKHDCRECWESISEEESGSHVWRKHLPGAFGCSACDSALSSEAAVSRHIQKVHGGKATMQDGRKALEARFESMFTKCFPELMLRREEPEPVSKRRKLCGVESSEGEVSAPREPYGLQSEATSMLSEDAHCSAAEVEGSENESEKSKPWHVPAELRDLFNCSGSFSFLDRSSRSRKRVDSSSRFDGDAEMMRKSSKGSEPRQLRQRRSIPNYSADSHGSYEQTEGSVKRGDRKVQRDDRNFHASKPSKNNVSKKGSGSSKPGHLACQICGEQVRSYQCFNENYHVAKHSLTHVDEVQIYVCSLCERSAKSIKPFTCLDQTSMLEHLGDHGVTNFEELRPDPVPIDRKSSFQLRHLSYYCFAEEIRRNKQLSSTCFACCSCQTLVRLSNNWKQHLDRHRRLCKLESRKELAVKRCYGRVEELPQTPGATFAASAIDSEQETDSELAAIENSAENDGECNEPPADLEKPPDETKGCQPSEGTTNDEFSGCYDPTLAAKTTQGFFVCRICDEKVSSDVFWSVKSEIVEHSAKHITLSKVYVCPFCEPFSDSGEFLPFTCLQKSSMAAHIEDHGVKDPANSLPEPVTASPEKRRWSEPRKYATTTHLPYFCFAPNFKSDPIKSENGIKCFECQTFVGPKNRTTHLDRHKRLCDRRDRRVRMEEICFKSEVVSDRESSPDAGEQTSTSKPNKRRSSSTSSHGKRAATYPIEAYAQSPSGTDTTGDQDIDHGTPDLCADSSRESCVSDTELTRVIEDEPESNGKCVSLQCQFCDNQVQISVGRVCYQREQFEVHARKHLDQIRIYLCPICSDAGFSCLTRTSMLEHLGDHEEENPEAMLPKPIQFELGMDADMAKRYVKHGSFACFERSLTSDHLLSRSWAKCYFCGIFIQTSLKQKHVSKHENRCERDERRKLLYQRCFPESGSDDVELTTAPSAVADDVSCGAESELVSGVECEVPPSSHQPGCQSTEEVPAPSDSNADPDQLGGFWCTFCKRIVVSRAVALEDKDFGNDLLREHVRHHHESEFSIFLCSHCVGKPCKRFMCLKRCSIVHHIEDDHDLTGIAAPRPVAARVDQKTSHASRAVYSCFKHSLVVDPLLRTKVKACNYCQILLKVGREKRHVYKHCSLAEPFRHCDKCKAFLNDDKSRCVKHAGNLTSAFGPMQAKCFGGTLGDETAASCDSGSGQGSSEIPGRNKNELDITLIETAEVNTNCSLECRLCGESVELPSLDSSSKQSSNPKATLVAHARKHDGIVSIYECDSCPKQSRAFMCTEADAMSEHLQDHGKSRVDVKQPIPADVGIPWHAERVAYWCFYEAIMRRPKTACTGVALCHFCQSIVQSQFAERHVVKHQRLCEPFASCSSCVGVAKCEHHSIDAAEKTKFFKRRCFSDEFAPKAMKTACVDEVTPVSTVVARSTHNESVAECPTENSRVKNPNRTASDNSAPLTIRRQSSTPILRDPESPAMSTFSGRTSVASCGDDDADTVFCRDTARDSCTTSHLGSRRLAARHPAFRM